MDRSDAPRDQIGVLKVGAPDRAIETFGDLSQAIHANFSVDSRDLSDSLDAKDMIGWFAMHKRTLFKAFLLVVATCCPAWAAEPLKSRIIGPWRLVSVYDQFADGTRRDTWGANPQGLVVFTPEGLFSAIIVAGQRSAKAGAVPSEPVGPAVAYYGAYRIDEATSTFTTQVQQSTFPPWIGRSLDRTVDELTARSLKVVAAPIRDPSGREFVPHLEFERVEQPPAGLLP